jgi:predicted dithiol-disulfide oxidoreductase (DUF899 family)/DNA gyrase inhibitor GyrI
MKAIESPVSEHKIVSNEEWIEARKAFLAKEKEFTRQRDELSRLRRELPWVKVGKNYVFGGPDGVLTLSDLFAGNSQLIIYHFMLGPGWEQGCPSCSFLSDHIDGVLPHLNARDVTLAVVSRAPQPQIETFKKRMGWRFNWVSSYGSDFNFDYQASFKKDEGADDKVYYNYDTVDFPSTEGPGVSVFCKDSGGHIFHTYSSYARGVDILVGAYNYLDIAPKGRDEDGLAFSMSWVRHRDRYDNNYEVDPTASYQHPKVVTEEPSLKVQIKKIEPIRVAFVRHIGPYMECGAAWGKLMPALTKRGVTPGDSMVLGIGHDNPEITPAAELRYDACVSVGEDFQPDGEISVQTIPGGEYAVATYVGPYDNLSDVYRAFLGRCLPESGREIGTGFCFEVYVNDAAKTAPADLITEIYAPLRSLDAGCCSGEL